jgi:hypothetical protein
LESGNSADAAGKNDTNPVGFIVSRLMPALLTASSLAASAVCVKRSILRASFLSKKLKWIEILYFTGKPGL